MPFPRLRSRWRLLFLPSLVRRRSSTPRPQPFGCGLGVDDLLLTKLGKKSNRHLDLSLGKGIHKRVKAVAVGGHAPIIGSPSRWCSPPNAVRVCDALRYWSRTTRL